MSAAAAPAAGWRRRYEARDVQRILTPTGGFLRGFAFSLNPYIGCAFGAHGGCPFCYVRALAVAQSGAGAWGSWVIAKRNLKLRLERELSRLREQGKLGETTIFMSSATDPYQGLERRLGLTRAALELLTRFAPRRLLLQTRSPLVERDVDLLRTLGPRVIVSLTLETDDERVRRLLTPTSPSITRRLRTAALLRAHQVFVQIAIAPMLPNHPERFAALLAPLCERVVLDTYVEGDGSGGRRSRALGIPELYRRLGFEGWFEPAAAVPLREALRARLGAERVLLSGAGFNAV